MNTQKFIMHIAILVPSFSCNIGSHVIFKADSVSGSSSFRIYCKPHMSSESRVCSGVMERDWKTVALWPYRTETYNEYPQFIEVAWNIKGTKTCILYDTYQARQIYHFDLETFKLLPYSEPCKAALESVLIKRYGQSDSRNHPVTINWTRSNEAQVLYATRFNTDRMRKIVLPPIAEQF